MEHGNAGIDALTTRVDGLEVALDEAVPSLVGALVDFLSQKGIVDAREFAAFLRGSLNPDMRLEDTAGHLLAELAKLADAY